MKSIGIDPSINSTGACVIEDGRVVHQYVIGYKPSKASLDYYKKNNIRFIDYGKNTDSASTYADKERLKSENLITLSQYIKFLIYDNSPDIVVMEGVSYGSTSGSSLVDLAGLNYLFRREILGHCENLVIASPMEIKKFAAGNGGVDKDIMIRIWQECLKMPDPGKAKIDDVADAYFMALYGICQLDKQFESNLTLPKVDIDKNNTPNRRKKQMNVPDEVLQTYSEIDV